MNKKGFTLIELLITIAIIGILAAAATTAYVGSIKKAARSEAYSNLDAIRLLQESFFADSAAYAPDDPADPNTIDYNGTCPNSACSVADDGIEDFLPGFKPGGCCEASPFGLNFTYSITRNVNITGGGNTTATPPTTAATATPCFVATATGVPGSRVAGDIFAIDCNNSKNY